MQRAEASQKAGIRGDFRARHSCRLLAVYLTRSPGGAKRFVVRLGRLRDVVAARQLVIARQPLPNRLGSTTSCADHTAQRPRLVFLAGLGRRMERSLLSIPR